MAVKEFKSSFTNSSIVSGDVKETEFFPDSANLHPKFSDKFPKTAVEVWLFDALANDGGDAFTVSFLRDSLVSPNGFRVTINATCGDGTNWTHQLVAPVSTVTTKGLSESQGLVTGSWSSLEGEEDAFSATFEVAENLSNATVKFDIPGKIKGSLKLFSKGYDCLPKAEDEAKASSNLFWMRPVAMASASLDVTMFTDNSEPKRMNITAEDGGYGGIDRSWEGMPWTMAVTDSLFVRAHAGPYVMQVMRLIGRPEKNYEATATARLYCNGKLICAAQRIVDPHAVAASEEHPGLTVEKLDDGEGLPAPFRSNQVGYRIEFLAGAKWSFELRHSRAWWAWPTSKPGPGGTGSSAFIVSVKGGLVGSGDTWNGWGMDGQVEMPE